MTEEVTDVMLARGMTKFPERIIGTTFSSELEAAYLAMEAARIPAAPDDVVELLGECRDRFRFLGETDWVTAIDAALSAIPIPAPTGEVERLRELLQTKRDYVADAALGVLTYKDSGEGFIAMAKEDLARIDAALTDHTTKDDE